MKKVMSLLIAVVICCSVCAVSISEDTGIQMVAGPALDETEDVNLDDMKVGQTAHIGGFGDVVIKSVEWLDWIYSVGEDNHGGRDYYSDMEAEYLVLNVRILNTNKRPMNYLTMMGDVICDYGDGYQFKGWIRQYNEDTDRAYVYDDANISYEINPLYAGRYAICVTLPNICVDSKEPLSVTFTIGNNEFTYIHHR